MRKLEITLPPAGLGLATNYTFTIANENIVAAALSWLLRRPDYPESRCLEIVRNPEPKFRKWIMLAMRYAPPHLHEKMKIQRRHNLVPATLRYSFATLLSGTDVAPTFKVNYIALGDGTTPPAAGDTQLVNETVRGTFDDTSSENEFALFNRYFPSSEVGGNDYQEAALFVDGTGTPDSGWPISRVLLEVSPQPLETLTINASIAVNAA